MRTQQSRGHPLSPTAVSSAPVPSPVGPVIQPVAAGAIPPESEAQFQAAIVQLAKVLGWGLIYHTYDSRRSAAGFPDLILCRPPRVVALECKRTGGKITTAQEEWIRALSASNVEAYIVWPESMPFIASLLQRKP